jgi:iron complex transport system substrate-binding protein
MRICSLLPSATEIVCSLGLEDALVGISHECDYPPSVRAKPALIRPRVDPAAPAAEIDRQVRELIGRGESIYSVDAGLLLRLAPDLILTQDLCHVCAASPDDLATALARAQHAPRVLSLTPRLLRDVWNDVRTVGAATGRAPQADALARTLEARVAAVTRAATQCGAPPPRVVCLEWLSPLYVAGHWVPEMVAAAGGEDVLGRAGEPSFCVTWEQVIAAQPDVVFIMPCGYGLGKAAQEFAGLELPAAWPDLPAVRSGRVFAVDANSYFTRPGPRLADGVELLARLLWSQTFDASPAAISLQSRAVANLPTAR